MQQGKRQREGQQQSCSRRERERHHGPSLAILVGEYADENRYEQEIGVLAQMEQTIMDGCVPPQKAGYQDREQGKSSERYRVGAYCFEFFTVATADQPKGEQQGRQGAVGGRGDGNRETECDRDATLPALSIA